MITFEQVRDVVAAELGKNPSELKPSDSFVSLDLDSLEKASLILELENTLKVELPDDDAGKLCRLGDVVDYANSHCVTA